jgi:hypothetical protein
MREIFGDYLKFVIDHRTHCPGGSYKMTTAQQDIAREEHCECSLEAYDIGE